MSGQTPPVDNFTGATGSGFVASGDDVRLLASLRNGDDDAFATLIQRHYASMVRIAMIYVSDPAIAEDVVQETWIAVLRSLDRFEGRSSLKTWIFSILTNRAKTRAQREGRYVPLASPLDTETEGFEPAVSPDRFYPADDMQSPGEWLPASKPNAWDVIPEDRLLSQETLNMILTAIEALPPGQRQVIRLRDVEGWSSTEVCNTLAITETNQRVLLHRARSKVRQALEQYFAT